MLRSGTGSGTAELYTQTHFWGPVRLILGGYNLHTLRRPGLARELMHKQTEDHSLPGLQQGQKYTESLGRLDLSETDPRETTSQSES